VEQVLGALEGGGDSWRLIGPAIDALRAALEQCSCGDRHKDKCPGEWEPGCDLGNNPDYAKRVELQRPAEVVAWIDNTGHPKHRLYRQSATEKRLYGPLRPLYAAPPTTTTQPEPK
jgi:hypothetical protein